MNYKEKSIKKRSEIYLRNRFR